MTQTLDTRSFRSDPAPLIADVDAMGLHGGRQLRCLAIGILAVALIAALGVVAAEGLCWLWDSCVAWAADLVANCRAWFRTPRAW